MELSIIIRTDGTIVNSATGEEILLKDVIAIRRANEQSARAAAKKARDDAKADRVKKQREAKQARVRKLEAKIKKDRARLEQLKKAA